MSDDPDIDFASAIDAPATLTMYRGDDPSEVDGIVVDFEQSHAAGGQSEFRYAYRAVLVPRLWRLGLSFQSRIYQNLTIQEIVSGILDEAEVDHEWMLSETYAPREYTTQYKETDLDFVQRLLEYEGIWYHFTHEDGRDTAVFCDDTGSVPTIEGDTDVPYSHADGLRPDDSLETIRDFLARQRLVTGKTELKDYNYRTPETELFSESEIDGELATGKASDAMTHVGEQARGDRLATVRNEEIESTRLVMTGTGDCLRFRAGYQFSLLDHYREGLNQTYLLTSVTHAGRQPDAAEAQSAEEVLPGYSNRFTCLPASAPYRPPRRTPEPKLPGVLTAKVESAGGTYAPVDDQGRYRVRFPFDLGDAGEAQATKPVRLAQPYTGPGYGQHFPVHKDVEMVVACVDGNVDRILGISTVYNPTQNSPVTSDNPSDNVLRSWGQNELTFRDEQGSEEVFMNATKDHTVTVANDETISVGHDRDETVGHDETLHVGNDRDLTIGHDATLSVGHDQTVSVGNDRDLTVAANLTETVGQSMKTTVNMTKEENVLLTSTLLVGASYSVKVGATKSETIAGTSTESVGGKKTSRVIGDLRHSCGRNYAIDVSGDVEEKIGKSVKTTIGKDASTNVSDNLSVIAGKRTLIQSGDELVIKCGQASITLQKNGNIKINGKKLDLKGSSDVKIKGSKTGIQ